LVEEQVFLSENNVTVTRSRIVIGNQTYPVANITSIRTDSKPPNLIWPFLMGVIGFFLLIAGIVEGGTAFLIGVVLIGAAVVWWRQAKPTHTIFFGTAGGERRALESEDGDYVQRVARAIDEALIAGR
jgi:uncharacterized protein DUF6232